MRSEKLSDMVRGWFVGNFKPTLYATGDVEVGVQTYKSGDYSARHFHKIATEITVVISGEVEMSGRRFVAGDMIIVEPGEATDFRALTDVVNVVVKLPGASNDKFLSADHPDA